ncbi:hypothetical protein LZ30DRAFT_784196 [Colletotrichum cereale]|nr:hypothetical protein LZ30DRAFT_784196 [Colletotrichum cereale]
MSLRTVAAATMIAAANLVAGHGAIIGASSPLGGTGMAIGVNPDVPRDGTRAQPFQTDSTRFKGANAATFGQTTGGGENDVEAGTKAIMAMTGDMLPQVAPGSTLEMTVHQVNGDGAGPYDCMINADGTGASWTNVNVPVTVPGQNSRNRDGAMQDFPLKAEIPADQTCTGTVAGQANVCLVRCQNGARAGPFGGIVPVQMSTGTTPAAARRNLARAIGETERQFKRMVKRAVEAADEEDEEEE